MRILVILFSICVVKCLSMSQSEIEDFTNFLEVTSQLDLNVKSKGPDDEYDEDEPISDNAWEESGKFEGDLILNERQRRILVADVAEGLSRNGLQDISKRWPNNEVIYYIQREHFSSGQAQAIQAGIDDLAQVSCVKFTPYVKGDRDAVVIQGSRRGCFSQVGYQGGYQVLNLSGRHPVGRGCFRHGTIVHELLHSLGFYHMQSSPDRDDYIDVVWQNIIKPARHNFRKYNAFAVNDFGVGYDYQSVLHYSRRAFSSNGQDTLVPKQLGAEIGQRVGLSEKDIQKLNKMYCDVDFDDAKNADSDSVPNKPAVTKKKSKNKPFVGHGIGYHQGKTVVIKLEPVIESYPLHTLPNFQTFDYFSNAQQGLPQALTGTSGDERKIINLPSTSRNVDEFYNPTTSISVAKNMKKNEDVITKTVTLSSKYNKPVKLVNDENHNEAKSNDERGSDDLSEELDKDLAEAFQKLSDKVQSQYNPSNTYFTKDGGKYYNPDSEKISDDYSIERAENPRQEYKHFQNRYGKHNFPQYSTHSHASLVENESKGTYPVEVYNYSPYVFNTPNY